MRSISSHRSAHEVADRLMDWHDQAKLAGRAFRATVLLDLAWHALNRPAVAIMEADRATARQFRALVQAT